MDFKKFKSKFSTSVKSSKNIRKIEKSDKFILELLKKSSIYAISQIGYSSFYVGRVLWFLVLLACLIGGVTKIRKFYNLYTQYPVKVNLDVYLSQSLEFPAVSVCNLNRVEIKSKCNRIPDDEQGTPLLFSERRNLHQCKKGENGTKTMRRNNKSKSRFLKTYHQLDEQSRFEAGHNPLSLMEDCSFSGRACSSKDLTYFPSFRYGNCMTFNKRITGENSLQVSDSGAGSGLIFKLRVIASSYHDSTHTIGARLVIHDPSDIPNPEDDGFTLSPGYEILMSLKKSVYRRLPYPYKDKCMGYNPQNISGMRSQNDCVRSCIQKQNFKKCGCIDQTLGGAQDLKLCDVTNEKEACCLNDVLSDMPKLGPICKCPLPCSSISYGEKLSKSLFMQGKIVKKHHMTDFYDRKCTVSPESIRINVFYSSLETQVYDQRPMWENSELLSFIGNEFGLWLGLSLSALFDLLEKLISFINLLFLTPYQN